MLEGTVMMPLKENDHIVRDDDGSKNALTEADLSKQAGAKDLAALRL